MLPHQETMPVEVITREHRYRGLAVNRGRRLADVLSSANSDFLEMREALVSTIGCQHAEIRCGQILLKKEDILLAIPKGKHEAPGHRRNKYVEKDCFGAIIFLRGYTLSGLLHLGSQAAADTILGENSSVPVFIGVTNVTVHGAAEELDLCGGNTVIVRRRSIEAVQLTARPVSKPQPSGGKTQEEQPRSLAPS